ncbi:MAG: hypothetical protein R8K53_05520 [Mariprofundaceae bacterium]
MRMLLSLLFAFLLMSPVLSMAAMQQTEVSVACEQQVLGHFVDAEHGDSICLRLEAIHGSDGENHLLRLFYISASGVQQEREMIAADILNDYESTTRVESCRDPDTGLDQLIFSKSMGGTSNGDASTALFVYYDQQQMKFSSFEVNAQLLDHSCSRKKAAQRFQLVADRVQAGDGVYRSLKPPKGGGHRFASRLVRHFDFEETAALLARLNQAEDFEPWQGASDSIDGMHFEIEVLAENEQWRVVLVSSMQGQNSSWGVVLAENRISATWRSFYDVPGGSSKVFIFVPHDATLTGDILQLKLCTDCSWWGEYGQFQVNLKTFSYTQLAERKEH